MFERFVDLLWDTLVLYLVLGTGFWFTFLLKGYQFRRFFSAFTFAFGSKRKTTSKAEITSFQAFCAALASRVGSGNIAGVALAVRLGGPGALFWMWMAAFLNMSTSLAETTLAQVYKTRSRDPPHHFFGGPAQYIACGIGSRAWAQLFAVVYVVSSGTVVVQANTIAQANMPYGISDIGVGIVLAILTGAVVIGGAIGIARFSEAIVPPMALLYIVSAILIVLAHINQLPTLFWSIISNAFSPRAIYGVSVFRCVVVGVKRGLFSNEAGLGSTPTAAALATPHPNHPIAQGMLGMVGVFVDTVVICSCTGFVVLLSDAYNSGSSLTGFALAKSALEEQAGKFGGHFLVLMLNLFAFTTIIATNLYAETNLGHITSESNVAIWVYRVLFLGSLIFGALVNLEDAWALTDILLAVCTVTNLLALLRLSWPVLWVMQNYEHLRKTNQPIEFDRTTNDFFNKTIPPGVWEPSQGNADVELDDKTPTTSTSTTAGKHRDAASELVAHSGQPEPEHTGGIADLLEERLQAHQHHQHHRGAPNTYEPQVDDD